MSLAFLNPLDNAQNWYRTNKGTVTNVVKKIGYSNPLTAQPTAILDATGAGNFIPLGGSKAAPAQQDSTSNVVGEGLPSYVNPLGYADEGTSGGGGAGTSSAQLQALRDAYAQKRSTLQGFYDLIPGQQQSAIDSTNKNYGMAANMLANTRQSGMNDIGLAEKRNIDNRNRSFQDIASGIRNSVDAFRNKLGTMGAADSSAAYVTAPYAFAQLQAQQRGDVNKTYGDNATDIAMQKSKLETDYNNQKMQIDTDYQNRMSDIAQKYNDLKTSIWQQMQDASAEEQAALAEYGQTAARQALMSIADLNSQWQANTSSLQQKASEFLNAFKPNITAPVMTQQDFNQYGASTAGTVDGMSNTQNDIFDALGTRRKLDEASYIPQQFLRDEYNY